MPVLRIKNCGTVWRVKSQSGSTTYDMYCSWTTLDSEVGGCPSWLSLEYLPSEKDLECKSCQKPMIFLCQIYAPITSLDSCFHRALFIFICREGSCSEVNNASNIKVFRSQLPRKNKYYSFDPPKEQEQDSETPSAMDYGKLCRVCGSFGPKVCGGCKLVSYCSKEHQSADWKSGHKAECAQKEIKGESQARKNIMFHEYEIDLEPEELEGCAEESDEEVLKKYEHLLKRGQPEVDSEDASEYDDKDLVKMAARETDKQFAKFRTRISQYPDQVLRYDRGGQPLFVSLENQPKDVPVCEYCGKDRQFECQIMPQLLVHLKVDSLKDSIDWGTVLIYSCSESCNQEGVSYAQEVVYKQDYSPSTDFLRH